MPAVKRQQALLLMLHVQTKTLIAHRTMGAVALPLHQARRELRAVTPVLSDTWGGWWALAQQAMSRWADRSPVNGGGVFYFWIQCAVGPWPAATTAAAFC